MCSLEPYKIDLKALESELTELNFSIMDDFFEALDTTEVTRGKLSASASIRTGANFFELCLNTKGSVTIQCDRCLEDLEQSIDTENRFVVKFGEGYSEDDDMIIVDANEGILDLSWLIYESIVLALPLKHVHAPGKCGRAMTEILEGMSAARSSEEEGEQPVDPRWAALAGLKTDI